MIRRDGVVISFDDDKMQLIFVTKGFFDIKDERNGIFRRGIHELTKGSNSKIPVPKNVNSEKRPNNSLFNEFNLIHG